MRRYVAACVAAGLLMVACGSDDKPAAGGASDATSGQTITLVTHDAFAVTPAVLQAFTDRTGIKVNVVKGGDAGAMVNQAILTKDHPQGDVLYGIDNTLLSKGLDAGLFDAYTSPELSSVDRSFDLDGHHRVTPVDESDVCLNYDKRAGTPANLDDLKTGAFKDKTVVENPATSSTGLAFLFATIAKYGENGYLDYWRALKDNGLKVDDSWNQAYNDDFTLGSGGTGARSVVASYSTSPPADVVFADPPKTTTDVGVVDDACFRQIEFVGVLKGTSKAAAAHAFVDFMLSKEFQEDMPLNMFVYPVRTGVALPDAFTAYSTKPAHTVDLPQDQISANRERWIDDWTSAVLG